MNTVLVVEDNETNWQIFQKILTKRGGFNAKHSENVEEVMDIATSRQADVILMDVCLDNSFYEGKPVNGIEITKMLKANPNTANVPVILVTALGTQNDAEHFIKISGADGYIAKPVMNYHDFIARIKAKMAS
ncbi:MAG: response regulator [Cyanobacteriota bacterium]|nr:response regulator [Cyanobacteriota bacterium]